MEVTSHSRGGPSRTPLDLTKIAASVDDPEGPVPRLLRFHDAHPITYVMVLMKYFGVEWFEWDPEVLDHEIQQTFNVPPLDGEPEPELEIDPDTNLPKYGAKKRASIHNWEKIQAARTLMTTVGFWREWEIFEKVIQSLNNNIPRFDVAQPCSIAQLMAGVDIANSMRVEQFSDEIARYVAACAMNEGVTYLPPPLDFAQRILSEPQYHCQDCGRIDIDDLDDDRCDFCCGRFSDEHPLNMKASRHVPEDRGRNIKRFLTRDPESTRLRFDELKLRRKIDLSDESPEDVQAAKLMVAFDYMKLRQRQLEDQLEELEAWVIS